MDGAQVTIWYDSGCPLCAAEIAFMRKLDGAGRIAFVDVVSAVDCPLDRAALLARFHAREGAGPVVSGAAAFAAMWRAIPLLAPFGHLARLPPVLWLLERAYRAFLRIRPRLQSWMRTQGA
jgi:predicted DCC family thiol-disulfide oxidoreductase YuxK